MKIRNVVYKTRNIVVVLKRKVQNTTNCVIIGSGYSLSVNEKGQVIYKDPLFFAPSGKGYGNCDVFSMFFTLNCLGLQEAGKDLADFINNKLYHYSGVILHGHSKCGACFLNLAQWLNRKVSIISISAPINISGAPITSPEFNQGLNIVEAKLFNYIYSNHKVDKDISPNSNFLKNINLVAFREHRYKIIVSTCCRNITFNPVSVFLKWFDKMHGINGDGIIPLRSQVPTFCSFDLISATHAESMHKGIKFVKPFL